MVKSAKYFVVSRCGRCVAAVSTTSSVSVFGVHPKVSTEHSHHCVVVREAFTQHKSQIGNICRSTAAFYAKSRFIEPRVLGLVAHNICKSEKLSQLYHQLKKFFGQIHHVVGGWKNLHRLICRQSIFIYISLKRSLFLVIIIVVNLHKNKIHNLLKM